MCTMLALTGMLVVATASATYPVTHTNCGVQHTVASAPQRVITMNQGATEFLLSMGLQGSMVGTAYLDDAIWPKYANAYNSIPVLASGYPNETTIMASNPDFIVASYKSAFAEQWTDGSKTRGIYSSATVGPCTGTGSEWSGQNRRRGNTCRPQLHSRNIGTYLFEDACEDSSLKQTATEEFVYTEMRAMGAVFGVDAQPLIDNMKKDFDAAAALVSSSMAQGRTMKTVWLDCVDCRGCKATDKQLYVGAGQGVPNMLMNEAGLSNVFSSLTGNWGCASASDIAAAKPDVIVVVDASWDTASEKIEWLYNHSAFCELGVLKSARLVSIPFSASTLSPRSGPAALDLARAALHVRCAKQIPQLESGVSSFSPSYLRSLTANLACPLSAQFTVYTDGDAETGSCTAPVPTTTGEMDAASHFSASRWLLAAWASVVLHGFFC